MLAAGPYTGSASDPKPIFPGFQSTLCESCGVSVTPGDHPAFGTTRFDFEGEDLSDVEA